MSSLTLSVHPPSVVRGKGSTFYQMGGRIHEKEGGGFLKGRLGQFADLGGGLARKKRVVFLGVLIPQ